MSVAELLAAARDLPRPDKYLLVQELVAELAGEERETPSSQMPVWSPFDAHDAAATLSRLLEEDRTPTK